MGLIKIIGLLLAVSIMFLGCNGKDNSTGPSSGTIPVYCKSPITNTNVPKEVALTEAIQLQKKRYALGDSVVNNITVTCNDSNPVVLPTGEVVPEE